MDPKTLNGAFAWIVMGIGGAVFALGLAQFFPSMIPAKATTVRL